MKLVLNLLILIGLFVCAGTFAAEGDNLADLIAAFESEGSDGVERLLAQSPVEILARLNATPLDEQRDLNRRHPEAWSYLTFRILQLTHAALRAAAPRPTVRAEAADTWTEILRAESLRHSSQIDVRAFLEERGASFENSGKLLESERLVRNGNWFGPKTLPILWETIFRRLHVLRANGCNRSAEALLNRGDCVSILRQIYGALSEAWLVEPRANFIPGAAIRVGGRLHADGWQVSFPLSDESESLIVIESLIEIKPSVVAFHQKGMYQIHGFLKRLLEPRAEILLYGQTVPRHLVRVRTKQGLLSLDELRAQFDPDLIADGEISDAEFESPAIAYDGRWGAFVDVFHRTFAPEFYDVVLPSDEVAPISRHLADLPNRPAGIQTSGNLSLKDNRAWAVDFLLRNLPIEGLGSEPIWNALFSKENLERSVIVRVLLDRPAVRSRATSVEAVTLDPRYAAKDYSGMLAEGAAFESGYRRLKLPENAEKLAFLRDVFLPYAGWRAMQFSPGRYRSISVSKNRLKIDGTLNFQPVTFEWVDPAVVDFEPRWATNGNGYLLRIPRAHAWRANEATFVTFDRGLLGHDLKRFLDDEEIVQQRRAFGEWHLNLKEGQRRLLADFELSLDADPTLAARRYIFGPVGYGKNTLMVQGLRARMRRLPAAPTRNVFLVVTRYRTSMDRTSRGLRRYPEPPENPLTFEHLSWESEPDRRRFGRLRDLVGEAKRRSADGVSIVLTSTWDYLAERVNATGSSEGVAELRDVLGGVFVDEADQIGIERNRVTLEKLTDANPVTLWAQEDHPVRREIIDRFFKGNLRSVYDVPNVENLTLEMIVGEHIEIGIGRGDLTPLAVDDDGEQVITHFTPESIMHGFLPQNAVGEAVAFQGRDIYAPISDESLRKAAYAHLVRKLEPTLRRNHGFLQGVRTGEQAEQMAAEFQAYFDEAHRLDRSRRKVRIVALHADTDDVNGILRRLDGLDPQNPIDWVITPQMFHVRRFVPTLSSAILLGDDRDARAFYDLVGQLMEPSLGKRRVEIVQIAREPSLNPDLIAKLGQKRRALESRTQAMPARRTGRRASAGDPPVSPPTPTNVVTTVAGPPTLSDLEAVESTHTYHQLPFFDPAGDVPEAGPDRERALQSLIFRILVETSGVRFALASRRCLGFNTEPERHRCLDIFEILRRENFYAVLQGLSRITQTAFDRRYFANYIDLAFNYPRDGTAEERLAVMHKKNEWIKIGLGILVPAVENSKFVYEPHPVLPRPVTEGEDPTRAFFENLFGIVPDGVVDRINGQLAQTTHAKALRFDAKEFAEILGPGLSTNIGSQFRFGENLDLSREMAPYFSDYLKARRSEWPISEKEVSERLGPAATGDQRSPLSRMEAELIDFAGTVIGLDINLQNFIAKCARGADSEAELSFHDKLRALLIRGVRLFPADRFFSDHLARFQKLDPARQDLISRLRLISESLSDYYATTYHPLMPGMFDIGRRSRPFADLPAGEAREQEVHKIRVLMRQIREAKEVYAAAPDANYLRRQFDWLSSLDQLALSELSLSPDLFDRAITFLEETLAVAEKLMNGEWVEIGDLIKFGRIDGTKIVATRGILHPLVRNDLGELVGDEKEIAVREIWRILITEISESAARNLVGRLRERGTGSDVIDGFRRLHLWRIREVRRGFDQLLGTGNRIAPLLENYLAKVPAVALKIRDWPVYLANWHQQLLANGLELKSRLYAAMPLLADTSAPTILPVVDDGGGPFSLDYFFGYLPPNADEIEADLNNSTAARVAVSLPSSTPVIGARSRSVRHLASRLGADVAMALRSTINFPDDLAPATSVLTARYRAARIGAVVGTEDELQARAAAALSALAISAGRINGNLVSREIAHVLETLFKATYLIDLEIARLDTLAENGMGERERMVLGGIVNTWAKTAKAFQAFFPEDEYLRQFAKMTASLNAAYSKGDPRNVFASLRYWTDEFRAYFNDSYRFASVSMKLKPAFAAVLKEIANDPNLAASFEASSRVIRSPSSKDISFKSMLQFSEPRVLDVVTTYLLGEVGSAFGNSAAQLTRLLEELKTLSETYHRAKPLPRALLDFELTSTVNLAGFIAGGGDSSSAVSAEVRIYDALVGLRRTVSPSKFLAEGADAGTLAEVAERAEYYAATLEEIFGGEADLVEALRRYREQLLTINGPLPLVDAEILTRRFYSQLVTVIPALSELKFLYTEEAPDNRVPGNFLAKLVQTLPPSPAWPLRLVKSKVKGLVDKMVDREFSLKAGLLPNTEENAQENFFRALRCLATQLVSDAGNPAAMPVLTRSRWEVLAMITGDRYLDDVAREYRNPASGFVNTEAIRRQVYVTVTRYLRDRYPELGLPTINLDGTAAPHEIDAEKLFAEVPPNAYVFDPAAPLNLSFRQKRELIVSITGYLAAVVGVAAEKKVDEPGFHVTNYTSLLPVTFQQLSVAFQRVQGNNEISKILSDVLRPTAALLPMQGAAAVSGAKALLASLRNKLGNQSEALRRFLTDETMPSELFESIEPARENYLAEIRENWPVDNATAAARVEAVVEAWSIAIPAEFSLRQRLNEVFQEFAKRLQAASIRSVYSLHHPRVVTTEQLADEVEQLLRVALYLFPKDKFLHDQIAEFAETRGSFVAINRLTERMRHYVVAGVLPKYEFDSRLTSGQMGKVSEALNEASQWIGEVRRAFRSHPDKEESASLIEAVRRHPAAEHFDFMAVPFDSADFHKELENRTTAHRDRLRDFKKGSVDDFRGFLRFEKGPQLSRSLVEERQRIANALRYFLPSPDHDPTDLTPVFDRMNAWLAETLPPANEVEAQLAWVRAEAETLREYAGVRQFLVDHDFNGKFTSAAAASDVRFKSIERSLTESGVWPAEADPKQPMRDFFAESNDLKCAGLLAITAEGM